VIRQPRPLAPEEIDALLALDVPAHLATVDAAGFPHVTPLWFVWADGAFHLTSFPDRPHLGRLRANAHAGLCIDIEEPERVDGERPNRQVRAIGQAELFADHDGVWTRRISEKYLRGPAASARSAARSAEKRMVIRVRPHRLLAVASVV
jgi:nitroimidazol reductase NimA-like FMN-containing flavoprotein (pyridoxamine 5'-phosphate oxidase superfamily)